MKIFVFTTVFAPRVGGIERITELLCREFSSLGHEVVLATSTDGDGDGDFPFKVIRRPSIGEFLKQLAWCDVHLQANISLKFLAPALLARRKLVYSHQNVYKRDDGSYSRRDRLKQFVARRTNGIANSRYTRDSLDCRAMIFNAYDEHVFHPVTPWRNRPRDLVFLGRLVSQKGCETLIDALAILQKSGRRPNLSIIGDGEERPKLEAQVAREGLADRVDFKGTLAGAALAQTLDSHRILVAPSLYDEPFGIVALEGLASGCLPVVSARGGLVDAIGRHGFTFPNGDAEALARVLERILAEPEVAYEVMDGVDRHLAAMTGRGMAKQFIETFEKIVAA